MKTATKPLESRTTHSFATKELSSHTWSDFEKLFSKYNGVWGGCWCMFYHGQGSFPLGKGKTPKNRKDEKRKLVSENRSHGIIVYDGMTPVGWCQYGVSEELPRIQTSRTYNKVAPKLDGRSGRLWRVTCFFIDKDYRGKGVASTALKSALNSIKQEGGGTVEAYPVATMDSLPRKSSSGKASFLWSGTVSMFEREGFKVVAELGRSRRLVRASI